jgi:hypothetical protein
MGPVSLFPFGFMPLRNTTHFIRADVKARAKAITKKFTIESSCELPPPLIEVKFNGLYVLLSKTDIVMDMKILEKLEKTMTFLMKMETKAALNSMSDSTFG